MTDDEPASVTYLAAKSRIAPAGDYDMQLAFNRALVSALSDCAEERDQAKRIAVETYRELLDCRAELAALKDVTP